MLMTLVPIVTLTRLEHQANTLVSDAGNAVGNRHAAQFRTGLERRVPDADDVGADRDVGQTGAVSERPVPDADNVVADLKLVRLMQSSNAKSPMMVTLLGIV